MATQHSYGKTVTSGLVLYLNAADANSYPGTGTAWNDLSGNGNTGTLNNGGSGLSYNSANGGSIVFDGTNDYIDVPAADLITTQFTLCAWIKNNGGVNQEVVCRYSNTTNTQRQFELWIDANGKLQVYAYKVGNTAWRTSLKSVNDVKYHYLVGVYNGSTNLDAYIDGVIDNGVLNGTIPSSVNTSITKNIEIGRYDLPSGYFNGNISNIQIYNRALSATEILQNYNASKSRFGLT